MSRRGGEARGASPLHEILVFTVLVPLGCSSTTALRSGRSTSACFLLGGLPLLKPAADGCGPTALAAVLRYCGMKVSQEEITKEVFSADLRGTTTVEMLCYPIEHGFDAELYNGDFNDLRHRISCGYPLIVSLKATPCTPRSHYAVVAGFDDAQNEVSVLPGDGRVTKVKYTSFLVRWATAAHLTLLVAPKVSASHWDCGVGWRKRVE